MEKNKKITKLEIQIPPTGQATINIKSPKKTARISESNRTKPTPIKTLDESQESISSADKQQFLMLQIKQLKRQNNFLKKKIIQLTAEYGPDKAVSKRGKQKQKGSPAQNLQFMPLSINLFFQQIHNMLNTIVKLFRIDFTDDEVKAYNQKSGEQINQPCPIKRHTLLKKYYLKRKLQRIMLQNDQNRFSHFLDLFTDYYQFKQQSDQRIIQTIDNMTMKAHQLNQLIIKKAQQKKKSKTTISANIKQEYNFETLKLPSPRNFVQNNKLSTYSPTNKRNKKTTKYALSPG